MSNYQGQRLGNYLLLDLLGNGGFGEVYLGTHVLLENRAAIKILQAHWTEEGKGDFLAEAKRLMSLNHPHIVRMLDFGMQGETSYLVMEYAAHGSLKDRHDARSSLQLPLPIDLVVTYVQQIASALQYLHDHKLIHRDVKPANMLLGANDTLLLSDVGLAVVAHSIASFSLQTESGTPLYMAPEQSKGRAVPASDQYALGVVVYEWLCGSPPFTSKGKGLALHLDLREQHLYVSPPSLRLKNPGISPAVEAVVLRALAKAPEERYPTITAFATALQQASQQEPFFSPLAPKKPAFSPGQSALSQVQAPGPNRSSAPTEAIVASAPSRSSPSKDVITPPNTSSQSQELIELSGESFADSNHTPPQRTGVSVTPILTREAPRRTTGRRKMLPIALVLFALLAIFAGTGYVVVDRLLLPNRPVGTSPATPAATPTATGSATITITPAINDLKKSYTIAAVAGTPDVSQHQVQGRMLSTALPSQSKTVQASGLRKTSPAYAFGTLEVFCRGGPNPDTLTIPAGTVFTGQDSMQVATDTIATVTAASGCDTTISAHAVVSGTSGNIPANDIDFPYGPGSAWIVINRVPFTGGQNPQPYTVVLQQDIDGAAHTLETANAPNAQQALQPHMQANEQLISSAQCNPKVTSDHVAGDQATTVTVTVVFTCTGEAYDQQGALVAAEQWLKQDAAHNPGAGYVLIGKIVTTQTNAQVPDFSQPTIAVSITAEGVWAYHIDDTQQHALAKLIAGKKRATAQSVLLQQQGIAKIDIQLSGGDQDTLPTDLRHITIAVLAVQGKSA